MYDAKLLKSLERVYGNELYEFMNSLLRPPSRLYVRINTLKTDVNEVIKSIRSKGFEVFKDELIEEAIYFPIKGPNKIPSAKKYVVADKLASESILLGANLYAPGLIKGEYFKVGDEVNILTPHGEVIAYGIAEMNFDEVLKQRKGLAIRVIRSLYEAPKIRELPEFKQGYLYPQSYPAILTSKFLEPKENDVIVDMCAAPGGKTGHLVELSKGKARIFAFDHSKSKIEVMIEEMKRLSHLSKIHIFRADSRYIDVDYPWIRPNKILLDPPCSSLGVRPKVYDEKKYENILNNAKYQWQFIKVAFKILRPKGKLLYTTCTVTCEENEELIKRAVNELGARVIEIDFKKASKGSCDDIGRYVLRFHPHRHDTTGYFIALLEKP